MALPYSLMVREASGTLALYSSLLSVARSAAPVPRPYSLVLPAPSVARPSPHMVLPFSSVARAPSVTLAPYSSLP